jgi:hypothetical protein
MSELWKLGIQLIGKIKDYYFSRFIWVLDSESNKKSWGNLIVRSIIRNKMLF